MQTMTCCNGHCAGGTQADMAPYDFSNMQALETNYAAVTATQPQVNASLHQLLLKVKGQLY